MNSQYTAIMFCLIQSSLFLTEKCFFVLFYKFYILIFPFCLTSQIHFPPASILKCNAHFFLGLFVLLIYVFICPAEKKIYLIKYP